MSTRHLYKPGPDKVGQIEESEIVEGFDPEITEGNKHWCLLSLGFKSIGKGLWLNDRLGCEIEFNVQTDNLPSLANKIFTAGVAEGMNLDKKEDKDDSN